MKSLLLGRTKNYNIEGVFLEEKKEGGNTSTYLGQIDRHCLSSSPEWGLYLPVALKQAREYLFTHTHKYLLMLGNIYYYS